jgi:hypothetical protein
MPDFTHLSPGEPARKSRLPRWWPLLVLILAGIAVIIFYLRSPEEEGFRPEDEPLIRNRE